MGLLRQGKRQADKTKRKNVKHHKRHFYNILEELKMIDRWRQVEGLTFTEDNIEEMVRSISDIKLGDIEKNLLLTKQYEVIDKQD